MNTSTDATNCVIDSVQRDGVGAWPDFAHSSLLDGIRREADKLLASTDALSFPKSTRVWDLYRHGDPFIDLLALPHLDVALTALLGENYLLSDYSLNVVNPHQPTDDWHLDYPYNEMSHLVSGGLLGVQCVLALDRFTPANGATCYVPGSHQPPTRPPADREHPHSILEAEPGTLLIMAASTWHRSGHNKTSRPRAAILLSFVERWVRPMTGPPEPGSWSTTERLRRVLGMERPPETINNVPITGPVAT